MLPQFQDKDEALFRKVLIISLLSYLVFSLFVLLVPYKPDLQKISIRPKKGVKMTEIPLKAPVPAVIPEKLREKQLLLQEQKRQEEARKKAEASKKMEEEKKKMDEAKRLAEERKRTEEARRREDEKRMAEEEKRRAEEEQRLAKERNREVAKNTGLLKAMQGRGKSADNLVNTEEIGNVLSQSQVKPVKPQKGAAGTAAGSAAGTQRPALKGSSGIGNTPPGVAQGQPGSLSGSRTISGRDIVPPGKEGASPFAKTTLRQTRSQESIKEVVKTHRGSLDFAYRKALRSDPTLKGIINIEFTIAPDGTIISARVASSTINDPDFAEDVLKRVRTWKFPAYPDSGNTVVTYPIEFSPA
ncbi:MAG: TonB family protein [Nitrospirae bacterium]|nr:TonB family protein [Nitrospirota bacterium]